MALVKAKVVSASSADKFGRVQIESVGLWEPSDLVGVLNAIPLNVGDVVYVDVSAGYANPMILGRARDNNFQTHASAGYEVGFSILYESTYSDGTWSVAYVRGGTFWLENSAGTTVEMQSGGVININEGKLRGLINIEQIESLIEALAKDLAAAMSGTNLSAWMASDMPRMEDKKVNH